MGHPAMKDSWNASLSWSSTWARRHCGCRGSVGGDHAWWFQKGENGREWQINWKKLFKVRIVLSPPCLV